MTWILGFIKKTWAWTLKFENCGDLWEDCFASLKSDANFRLPRSTGGGITQVEGELGSHYPHHWTSGLQSAPTTCSGESETVAYAKNVKQGIKLAAMVDYTTIKGRTASIAYVDNESVRVGVGHGYSPKISEHLKNTAGASFRLLQATHVLPKHLPGRENTSDMLTKTLPRNTLLCLLRRLFGLEISGVSSSSSSSNNKAMHVTARAMNVIRVDFGDRPGSVIGVGEKAVAEVRSAAANSLDFSQDDDL